MKKSSTQYPESHKKYLEYIDSEDDFESHVRLNLEWNDEKYQQLLELLRNVINDYRSTDLIPRSVMHFFTSGITRLTGTISHPAFLNDKNKDEQTLQEYRDLVTKRKTELLELQRKFISGELFQQD